MGVARFALQAASVDLEKVLAEIRADATISEAEKRRRELDIEIAISDAIKNLLGGGATVTAGQIQGAVQTHVIGRYRGFTGAGVAAVWPFPR